MNELESPLREIILDIKHELRCIILVHGIKYRDRS